jgi:hypothetical protein
MTQAKVRSMLAAYKELRKRVDLLVKDALPPEGHVETVEYPNDDRGNTVRVCLYLGLLDDPQRPSYAWRRYRHFTFPAKVLWSDAAFRRYKLTHADTAENPTHE